MPHPQTPVPLPPFPALGSASRCPRKPAAGVRAPTFPVPHLIPPSSEPPNGHFPGVSPALPGIPSPRLHFSSPSQECPPPTKSVLDAPGETSEVSQSRMGTWGPKDCFRTRGTPRVLDWGDTDLYPSFSTGILGPGFYVPLRGAENRLSALSGLAWDPPPRAPSLIRGRESVLHLHRLPSPCPVLSPFFVSLPLSISSCLLSPLLPSAS